MINFTKVYIFCWIIIIVSIGLSAKYSKDIANDVVKMKSNEHSHPQMDNPISIPLSIKNQLNKLPGVEVEFYALDNKKLTPCVSIDKTQFEELIKVCIIYLNTGMVFILLVLLICLGVNARKGFYLFWLILFGLGTLIIDVIFLNNRLKTTFSQEDLDCINNNLNDNNNSSMLSNVLKNLNTYASISCSANICILVFLLIAVVSTKPDTFVKKV